MAHNFVFPDPEDPDTWPSVLRGVGFTVRAQGSGVIIHVNGPAGYDPDDYAHGIAGAVQEPATASELCSALS